MVDFGKQAGGPLGEIRSGEIAQPIRSGQFRENTFRFVFEQMRWGEPGREFPKLFGFTEHCGAEFASPVKDVLEEVAVNRFQVISVKNAGQRSSQQLVAPASRVQCLEGG